MSQHYNMQHPAVGSVACPVCHAARGVPCSTTPNAAFSGLRTETHIGRVRLYERQLDSRTMQEKEHRDIEDGKLTGEYNG